MRNPTRTEYGNRRPNSEVISVTLNTFIAEHDQAEIGLNVSLPWLPRY
jgi:hypothetical protein